MAKEKVVGNYYSGIDRYGTKTQIDYLHSLVHQGKLFLYSVYDSDVDVSSPKYYLFKVASGYGLHVRGELKSTKSGVVQLYYNPTITNNGTEVTLMNYNANSDNTLNSKGYHDPTVGSDGTLAYTDIVGENQNRRLGGTSNPNIEFIFKSGTDYLIKFTVDEDNAKVTLNMDIYEEEL